MITFILFYLLGYFVSVCLIYYMNKQKIELLSFIDAIVLSALSWMTVMICIYSISKYNIQKFAEHNKVQWFFNKMDELWEK